MQEYPDLVSLCSTLVANDSAGSELVVLGDTIKYHRVGWWTLYIYVQTVQEHVEHNRILLDTFES